MRDAAQLDPLWVKTSFVFALVGISAKIGLAPMHPADIDATSNAPGPVAALMAGSLRSTAMLVLLRFYEVASNTSVRAFSQRFADDRRCLLDCWWRRFISGAAATTSGLLAYSSVEHLGIITLASGVGGAAMLGALLHTLFNSFGKIALFFMAGRINRDLQTREIDSVHGLMQRLPWSGFVFGLAFFYIVGTPPFGLFFSELLMLARDGSRAELAQSSVAFLALADDHLHRYEPRRPAHVAKSGALPGRQPANRVSSSMSRTP